MLNEEEKQAIKNLKEITELAKEEIKNNNKNASAVLDIIDLKSLNTVLNLITKQQKENEEKDNRVKKIINRLDNDYKRITETKSDGNHWDDYSKCRLKAYRTKTREIKEYIEKQYFETKAKKGE